MTKLFLALIFILLSLPVYADLGQTEKQILVQRPAAQEVTTDKIDDRGKVMLIKDKDTDYGIGLLDGKCEIEVFNNKDDSKFTSSFIVSHLKAYAKEWIPIECNEEACNVAMSIDGKYFAKLGPSKTLKRQNVLSIFTKKWGKYAKEIIASRKEKI